MIITTSLRSLAADVLVASRFAENFGGVYVSRQEMSLAAIQREYPAKQLVVVERGQPVVYRENTRFFFHRGMAELRILHYIRSGHDPMLSAMNLAPGMSVLDCTLGLAADALVAAFAVGEAGQVEGLEASPVIAALSAWGLMDLSRASSNARPPTQQAASRIRVTHAEHRTYLTKLPDDSFDVVYFDPMFRRPKSASTGIQPLREFAEVRPLDPASISEALRVARHRVVVKEAHGSREFERLGIRHFGGGRYSSVQYGILLKEEKAP